MPGDQLCRRNWAEDHDPHYEHAAHLARTKFIQHGCQSISHHSVRCIWWSKTKDHLAIGWQTVPGRHCQWGRVSDHSRDSRETSRSLHLPRSERRWKRYQSSHPYHPHHSFHQCWCKHKLLPGKTNIFMFQNQEKTVLQNETIVLECPAQALPPPVRTWTYEGEKIDSQLIPVSEITRDYYLILGFSTLSVMMVHWFCTMSSWKTPDCSLAKCPTWLEKIPCSTHSR